MRAKPRKHYVPGRAAVNDAARRLTGTVSDSFLGATLQGIFRCPSCENLTERRIHCGEHETVLHSGSRYVNNDLVNVMCGFSGGLFVYVALALVL